MNTAQGGAATTTRAVRGENGSIDGDVVRALRVGPRGDFAALEAAPAAPPELRPGVTVAICTYRRAASLLRLLRSLPGQTRRPAGLFIIDASPDDETEKALREFSEFVACAREVRYYRVQGRHKGLTRQRNFALDRVETDLTVFFDDDVVLDRDCLAAMEDAFRQYGGAVVGVGATAYNDLAPPSLLWRVRWLLGEIPELAPGRYYPTGISTSWGWVAADGRHIEGDHLPGCSMMWDTALARRERFNDAFVGYAQSEDLEFSVRMHRHGRLIMNTGARAQHLQEQGGRPDPLARGYMQLRNKYVVHRSAYPQPSVRERAQFIYGMTMEGLLLARFGLRPAHWGYALGTLRGRLRAAREIVTSGGVVTGDAGPRRNGTSRA